MLSCEAFGGRKRLCGGFTLCLDSDPSISSDAASEVTEVLPLCLFEKILLLLPPRTVASACALVSTKWAKICRSQSLWKEICLPWGLRDEDAASVLGGWRGLYGLAFGTNLLHSPCFESIQRSCSGFIPPWSSKDPSEHDLPGPFQSHAEEFVDRLSAANEIDPGYRDVTHWVDDKDEALSTDDRLASLWGRNNYLRVVVPHLGFPRAASCSSDSSEDDALVPVDELCAQTVEDHNDGSCRCKQRCSGVCSEPRQSNDRRGPLMSCIESSDDCTQTNCELGEGCPPSPGSPAIQISGKSWGMLKQCVSLRSFPSRFLDRIPPLSITAWYRSSSEGGNQSDCAPAQSNFRLQVFLKADDTLIPIANWDSGEFSCNSHEWQMFSGHIIDYPAGLKSLHVRVSGRGVMISKVSTMFQNSAHIYS